MTSDTTASKELELTPDDAPLSMQEALATLEASGKVQLEPARSGPIDELSEMRVIAKRLEALEPGARQRVLAWLTSRFA